MFFFFKTLLYKFPFGVSLLLLMSEDWARYHVGLLFSSHISCENVVRYGFRLFPHGVAPLSGIAHRKGIFFLMICAFCLCVSLDFVWVLFFARLGGIMTAGESGKLNISNQTSSEKSEKWSSRCSLSKKNQPKKSKRFTFWSSLQSVWKVHW